MSRTENDRERRVVGAFVGLADTLVDDYDVIEVLDRLVAHGVTLLSAQAAGIMLTDPRGRLQVVASSNEESGWTELMQLQADEGPCVDCIRTGRPVTVTDLDEAGARWPRFTASLIGRGGYRSVHAVPLRLRGDTIGALNLFHAVPGPLSEADLRLGQALADVATIGILQVRAVRQAEVLGKQLQAAHTSRIVIEQAKGVLAQSGSLTMEEAFDRLRRHARGRKVQLGDVARRVVTEPGFLRQVIDTPPR